MRRLHLVLSTGIALTALALGPVQAVGDSQVLDADPHYTALGFFDIHLCNWPERPEFFKVLFSTPHFETVTTMEVRKPDGGLLVSLDKSRFMTLRPKGKPEKRVYLADIDVPESATDGWYSIEVRTGDGRSAVGRDYVTMTRLQRVDGPRPANGAESVPMPSALSWEPVPGARHYEVYLRDAWTDELIFSSSLLDAPKAELPSGKLQAGGYYYWTVHSRDSNENILLGDFHMGSMSERFYFSVAEE